jgi:Domain of unknown function (DUF4263)
LQKVLKNDLSVFAKAFANPFDEYICFSEFPIGSTGKVDFAVFTNRSIMHVYLIEIKGAEFNLINNITSKGAVFNSKILEGIDQIIKRHAFASENNYILKKKCMILEQQLNKNLIL